jgi:hypothetical protein
MHCRAALACSALLFAIGCSDGTEPLTGPSGIFGAQLTRVRSGMLSGSAEAQEILIETGSGPGSTVPEVAEADGGSVTISVSNQEEVDGTCSFHGALVEGSDTVGIVSVAGSFRAKVFP